MRKALRLASALGLTLAACSVAGPAYAGGGVTATAQADGSCAVSGQSSGAAQAYQVNLPDCTVSAAPAIAVKTRAGMARQNASARGDASGSVLGNAIFRRTVRHTLDIVNQNSFLEVRDVAQLRWLYDGFHVGAVGSQRPRCSFARAWYNPLWDISGIANRCLVNSSQTVATAQSASRYNSPGPNYFCPNFLPTQILIGYHRIFGYYDGSFQFDWGVRFSGACRTSLFVIA